VRRRLPHTLVDVPPQILTPPKGEREGPAAGRGGGSTDPFLPTIARSLASQNGNCYPVETRSRLVVREPPPRPAAGPSRSAR